MPGQGAQGKKLAEERRLLHARDKNHRQLPGGFLGSRPFCELMDRCIELLIGGGIEVCQTIAIVEERSAGEFCAFRKNAAARDIHPAEVAESILAGRKFRQGSLWQLAGQASIFESIQAFLIEPQAAAYLFGRIGGQSTCGSSSFACQLSRLMGTRSQ